ncbi:Caspase-2, partial [Trichoplax sp. H2]
IAAQRYFNLIIKDIGAEWKDLARVLDFDQTQIKTIKANNSLDVNDQCAEMLHVQHNTKGKSFNKLELIKALYKANLAAVAEKINIDHEITQDPVRKILALARRKRKKDTASIKTVAFLELKHLFNILEKPPKMSSGSMTQEHREILRASRMLLARKCRDQISPIWEYLLEAEILTFYHKQVIESKSTAFEKVRTLLNILPERGDRAFDEFCNAVTYCEITVENFNSGLGSILQESEISRKEETAMQNAMNPNQDGNSGSKINRQQSTDTTEYLFDVADKLQEDWIKLVPKLDREGKIDIKKIQNKSNDHFDRGFSFLDEWHGIYGKSATKYKLKVALKVIKRADVADEIGI